MAAALAGHAAAFTAHAYDVTDVAARDNGVVIVLTGECAVSYDAVVAWCVVLAHEMNRGPFFYRLSAKKWGYPVMRCLGEVVKTKQVG